MRAATALRPPDSRWDRLERAHQVALLAGSAAVVGCLGPWFSPFGINTYGLETNGVLVIFPLLVGLACLWYLERPVARNTATAIAFALAAVVALYSFVYAHHRVMSWGLPLATLGAVVAAAAAFAGRDATLRLVPAPRTDPGHAVVQRT